MATQVSKRWKYATFALGTAVVLQFVWWDQKCPEVLRGGKNGKKGY